MKDTLKLWGRDHFLQTNQYLVVDACFQASARGKGDPWRDRPAPAGGLTSGLGLAAALQHKTDVVCTQDLLLEVAHQVSQAGEAAV